jgi:hypothetical protein
MRLWRHTAPSTGDLTPAPPQGTQASLLGCSFLAAERPTEPRTWLAAFIFAGHRWNRHLDFADRADLSDLRRCSSACLVGCALFCARTRPFLRLFLRLFVQVC